MSDTPWNSNLAVYHILWNGDSMVYHTLWNGDSTVYLLMPSKWQKKICSIYYLLHFDTSKSGKLIYMHSNSAAKDTRCEILLGVRYSSV